MSPRWQARLTPAALLTTVVGDGGLLVDQVPDLDMLQASDCCAAPSVAALCRFACNAESTLPPPAPSPPSLPPSHQFLRYLSYVLHMMLLQMWVIVVSAAPR